MQQEKTMGEITARVQQVTNSMEKAIVEQASHVEAAVGEVNRLQAASITQAGVIMDNVRNVVRRASDKLAFAGGITGEWGKQVLAATRTAAEALTKKS
jgi:hypothetical protein